MWAKLKWWHWALIAVFIAGGVGAIVDPPAPKAPPQQAKQSVRPKAEFKVLAGDSFFAMTFSAEINPETLPDLARERCGSLVQCTVIGWTDPQFAARGWPMTDREVEQQDFHYSLNRDTGHEQTLWNCRRWRRAAPDQCISS